MFYSHQLLARKTSLGQIWMAATMHAKMNRKKLNKLDLIKICEEILNPSVPMALRLSAILMGGVVIVYERKVKLLYDDANRLLVELNAAFKVKEARDPTVFPKGKTKARKEAVTLPDIIEEGDFGDIEQPRNAAAADSTTTTAFQQTAYFAMRLDAMDDTYINTDPGEEEEFRDLHQVDADNITLFESFDLYHGNTDTFNRFERFDDGDEETQVNNSKYHEEIPSTLIPSPTRQDEDRKADEIRVEHPGNHTNHHSHADRQDQQGQVAKKRKTERQAKIAMDYNQTIIPGHIYQTWLQSASDIVSRRGRKRKARSSIIAKTKIEKLMELPPMVLINGFSANGHLEIHYPAPLMELSMRSTLPSHDSPSAGGMSSPRPPKPSFSSPPQRMRHEDPVDYTFEDFHGGVGFPSPDVSIERQRATIATRNLANDDISEDFRAENLRTNFPIGGARIAEASLVTPGNSGDEVRSIPSSGSDRIPSLHSEVNSGWLEEHKSQKTRSIKKRPYSSSRHSGGNLEPVAEEKSWQNADPNFKLSALAENGPKPAQELFVETGPTQTQYPNISQPFDRITDSIRMQMKAHFETPGAPEAESLNKLAAGMNRKGAALLFYQACVLASRDVLKVEQKVPYGEILISRGTKM